MRRNIRSDNMIKEVYDNMEDFLRDSKSLNKLFFKEFMDGKKVESGTLTTVYMVMSARDDNVIRVHNSMLEQKIVKNDEDFEELTKVVKQKSEEKLKEIQDIAPKLFLIRGGIEA